MRGQAFVSFTDVESAHKARREVNLFPLYGKPMVNRKRALNSQGLGHGFWPCDCLVNAD